MRGGDRYEAQLMLGPLDKGSPACEALEPAPIPHPIAPPAPWDLNRTKATKNSTRSYDELRAAEGPQTQFTITTHTSGHRKGRCPKATAPSKRHPPVPPDLVRPWNSVQCSDSVQGFLTQELWQAPTGSPRRRGEGASSEPKPRTAHPRAKEEGRNRERATDSKGADLPGESPKGGLQADPWYLG